LSGQPSIAKNSRDHPIKSPLTPEAKPTNGGYVIVRTYENRRPGKAATTPARRVVATSFVPSPPQPAAAPGLTSPVQRAEFGHRFDRIEVAARAPVAPVVQFAKSAEERSAKQTRVAQAQKTIDLLGDNLKANLDGHLFNALPAGGGEADHDDPGGLHAYTNEKLPGGIKDVAVTGAATKVHTLTWRWSDSTNTKDSTMFPNWMPPRHVRTLIALAYPDKRAEEIEDKLLSPKAAKTYIQRGMDITLKKAGDTVYPTL
jgi:hypothetical protein